MLRLPSRLFPFLPADQMRYLGIDLGGITVKLGMCDADGSPCGRATIATNAAAGAGDTVARIAHAASALAKSAGPAPLTDASESEARAALEAADLRAKIAVVMIRRGVDRPAADGILQQAGGFLRKALEEDGAS